MTDLVKLLMRRDKLTRSEAEEMVAATRYEILMNEDCVDDIILNNLGVEPDYIFDILEG